MGLLGAAIGYYLLCQILYGLVGGKDSKPESDLEKKAKEKTHTKNSYSKLKWS